MIPAGSKRRRQPDDFYKANEDKYRECRILERRTSHIAHPLLAEGYGNLASRFFDMSHNVIIHVLQPYLMWHGQDRPGVVNVKRVTNQRKRLTAVPDMYEWKGSLDSRYVVQCFVTLPDGILSLLTGKEETGTSAGDCNTDPQMWTNSRLCTPGLGLPIYSTRLSSMHQRLMWYNPLKKSARPRAMAVAADGTLFVAGDRYISVLTGHSHLIFGDSHPHDYGDDSFEGFAATGNNIKQMVLDIDGNVLVSVRQSRKLYMFSPDGRLLRKCDRRTTRGVVKDICVDPATGNILVLNYKHLRVYDRSLRFITKFRVRADGSLFRPIHMAIDGAGQLFIVSRSVKSRVVKISVFDSANNGEELGHIKLPSDPSHSAHRSTRIVIDACGRIVFPGVAGRHLQFIY